MKRFSLLFAIFIALLLAACTFVDDSPNLEFENEGEEIPTKGLIMSGPMMILGQRLSNPYALDIMQAALDSLYPNQNISLPVTHLYVRFLPQDTAQMRRLKDDGLELFDFPLDREIIQPGYFYQDPQLSGAPFTWQYTTVSPFYRFPVGIRYEILERCHIPDEDVVTRYGIDYSVADLERAAFQKAGHENMWIESRAAVSPRGRFTVTNTETGRNDGIKGAKVRVHNFVKWATTYTSSTGEYIISKTYRTNVHYAIIFDNMKDFCISDYMINIQISDWSLFSAKHRMGFHSNSGYSKNIGVSSDDWSYAVINNAAYEYYNFCNRESIALPPAGLEIWEGEWFRVNGAPMLGKLIYQPQLTDDVLNNIVSAFIFSVDILIYRFAPDIILNTRNLSNTRDIYSIVFHELSHASHYTQAGMNYWTRYITYISKSYIMQGDCYGDGSLEDAGVCEVGEMWGYFNEDVMVYNHFDEEGVKGKQVSYNSNWFYPGICVLFDLYQDKILTQKQIFDCLTWGVDARDKLQTMMKQLNPGMEKHIDISFAENGFYVYKGEWLLQNMTQDTIRLSLSRDKRSIPEGDDNRGLVVPEGPTFQAKLSESYSLSPGETLRMAILPYSSEQEVAFSDFFNFNEVAPRSLYVADRDSVIFYSPYSSTPIDDFFDESNWIPAHNSLQRAKRWVFRITQAML